MAAGLSPGKLLSAIANAFPVPGWVFWTICGEAPIRVGPTVAVVGLLAVVVAAVVVVVVVVLLLLLLLLLLLRANIVVYLVLRQSGRWSMNAGETRERAQTSREMQ
jgi:hypothetical protein